MKLTKMIFDYWKIWMSVPVETNEWCHSWDGEGLTYCDGNVATFWWLLNVEWYRMNDKLYARTDCKESFDPCLRDFEEDYLLENGYK
jgi:hypothetical protein